MASAAQLLACEFQATIKYGDIDRAASDRFAAPMDNAVAYIAGCNPIRAWSEIPNDAVDIHSERYRQLKTILDRLLTTGAAIFANAVDPIDHKRPVDVADISQMAILIRFAATTGIDIRPTVWYSPLIRAIDLFQGPPFPYLMAFIWNDDGLLDWTPPTADEPALYVAFLHLIHIEKAVPGALLSSNRFDVIDRLLLNVGCVDPTRSCYDRPEFLRHDGINKRLQTARQRYATFVGVDLYAALTDVFIPPLAAVVRSYY